MFNINRQLHRASNQSSDEAYEMVELEPSQSLNIGNTDGTSPNSTDSDSDSISEALSMLQHIDNDLAITQSHTDEHTHQRQPSNIFTRLGLRGPYNISRRIPQYARNTASALRNMLTNALNTQRGQLVLGAGVALIGVLAGSAVTLHAVRQAENNGVGDDTLLMSPAEMQRCEEFAQQMNHGWLGTGVDTSNDPLPFPDDTPYMECTNTTSVNNHTICNFTPENTGFYPRCIDGTGVSILQIADDQLYELSREFREHDSNDFAHNCRLRIIMPDLLTQDVTDALTAGGDIITQNETTHQTTVFTPFSVQGRTCSGADIIYRGLPPSAEDHYAIVSKDEAMNSRQNTTYFESDTFDDYDDDDTEENSNFNLTNPDSPAFPKPPSNYTEDEDVSDAWISNSTTSTTNSGGAPK